MKKRYLLLVLTLVATCVFFTGCTRNNGDENTNPISEMGDDLMGDDAGNGNGTGVGNGDVNDMNNGSGTNNGAVTDDGAGMGSDVNQGLENTGNNQNGSGTNSTTTDDAMGTDQTGEEESTLTGTITEIKDFMFVVEDANGDSHMFSFEGDAPEGFDGVTEGDEVQVTYTGELSEVDAFTGEIIRVEKVQ